MACVLTQGFPLDCKDSVGGIEKIYITELANKDSINPTGNITAFTLQQGKQFWEYDLREETGSFTENINQSNVNGTVFYEQVTVASLDPLTSDRKAELALVVKNDVMIIVLDSNGRYWLAGENTGAYISAGAMLTGQAKGDKSGFDLTFTSKEKQPAREVSADLIPTLTAPAS